jgi:hypothetical protein
MPELITAKSAQEFQGAFKQFIANIKTDEGGHLSIARQCVNGIDTFWDFNRKRGEIYQYLVQNEVVVGLSRICIPKVGDAKIQDVVAYPDGKGYGALLINSAISEARAAEKKMIWLEAADEGVASYYNKKFQFQFKAKGVKSGRMELEL